MTASVSSPSPAPYLVSPITLDHDWLQQNLERVSIGTGDDGTAIGSAIAASVNRLRTTTAKSKVSSCSPTA
jgi:Ca-activated chloride channel family protein